MTSNLFARWLGASVVEGRLALYCGILAVALPTIVRAAVNGTVTGCEFTPYLPFVLVSAIMIGWWQAGAVALASVAVVGGLFVGPLNKFLEEPCAVSAAGIFLGSSAVIVAIVTMIRHVIADIQSRSIDQTGAGGVVFSMERGEVWASWNGSGPPMRLGSRNRVEAMMAHFMAQANVEERPPEESD